MECAFPGGDCVAGRVADQITADGRRETDEHLVASGADLIALGRPFPANPDLVDRIRTGAPTKAVRAKCDVHRLYRPPQLPGDAQDGAA